MRTLKVFWSLTPQKVCLLLLDFLLVDILRSVFFSVLQTHCYSQPSGRQTEKWCWWATKMTSWWPVVHVINTTRIFELWFSCFWTRDFDFVQTHVYLVLKRFFTLIVALQLKESSCWETKWTQSSRRRHHKMWSFFGALKFYQLFIKNKSSFMQPLHELLKKGAQWNWGTAQKESFGQAKAALSSSQQRGRNDTIW